VPTGIGQFNWFFGGKWLGSKKIGGNKMNKGSWLFRENGKLVAVVGKS
jgi:hypothetical protein